MKTMHLWVPDDQDRWGDPRAIAVGSEPPQSGKVFEVQAKGAKDADRALKLFLMPEPVRKKDRSTWMDWDEARERVRPLGHQKGSRAGEPVAQGTVKAAGAMKQRRDEKKKTKKAEGVSRG